MSGLAVFSLKYPSLLQFNNDRQTEAHVRINLKNLYGIEQAPCDTQMRTRLDKESVNPIHYAMRAIFRTLQRTKVLDNWRFLNEYYLLSVDATGFYSSNEIHCKHCCTKVVSYQLSIPLCKGLRSKGFSVICVDARHMAAALSARVNKNDKNDARGIAQMLKAGLHKEVEIKSDKACERKVLMGNKRQLAQTRQQIMGTIRGLLKIYGIALGTQALFETKVREKNQKLSQAVQLPIESLLSSLKTLDGSLTTLDKEIVRLSKGDEDCRRLITIPGVGAVTAMTYKAALDSPDRFKKSAAVGAYFGITPRQYASGEVNRQGSISKMGQQDTRTLLYEAAQCLLTRVKIHQS